MFILEDLPEEEARCENCGNNAHELLEGKKIRYSSCCGRCLCDSCVITKFPTQSDIKTCPKCQERVGRSSYKLDTIERQKYKRSVQVRKKTIETIFILVPADFEHDSKQYNDYLETIADYEYGMAYGTADEKKKASIELDKFKKAYQEKIQLRRDRKHSNDDNRMEVQEETSAHAVATGQYRGDIINVVPMARKRKQARKSNASKDVIRQAGGYKIEYDSTKSAEEADAMMFYGILY
mmetsp:Transcript_7078/g.11661  ORF Transcript_7078/g.11661 Transcript_7078/m.11661 type:complete len:237 (-) Transcript_7078:234-944(-)|eukprot:jgi/Bigna1/90185/estExt_fgenesh1_pg.C_640077